MSDLKQEIRERLYDVANFYSKREFTLDGDDYEGVDQALSQILKAVEQWGESKAVTLEERWGGGGGSDFIKAIPLSAFRQLSDEK